MRNVEMILLWVEVIVWPETINREQDDVARDSLGLQRIWGEESPEKDEKKDKFIELFYGCPGSPLPVRCPFGISLSQHRLQQPTWLIPCPHS